MQDVINKSARIIFFGEVMTLPDGETVYQVGDDYAQAVSELAEKGDIEVVEKKKVAAKSKE